MQLRQEARLWDLSCWSRNGSGADTVAEQEGVLSPAKQTWCSTSWGTGIFNGWGQKIHDCIPGSMMACLGLAVSVMACSHASHPACHPWCLCLLIGGFRSEVLADKVSSPHT